MAEIRCYPFFRHLRAEPTSHIVYYKNGVKRRSGRGLAFWFGPLGASLAEVPLEDRELGFLIQSRSADFQDVNVNLFVTYRVADPELLAARVDFSIDARTGRYKGEPLDKVAVVVIQLAQQLAVSFLLRLPLRAILDLGVEPVRKEIETALALDEMGIEIVSTRVASVKPSPEMEKALQMPTRERIQQEADEATFGRRALAVEKERAIAENELTSQIELARREEQLIAQRGQNEKKRVVDASEAKRIEVEAGAKNSRMNAEAQAESIRMIEESKVRAERDRMDIYRELPPAALMGLAARELAGKLQSIEHLNLTPDLLGSLLQRVLGAQAKKLESNGG